MRRSTKVVWTAPKEALVAAPKARQHRHEAPQTDEARKLVENGMLRPGELFVSLLTLQDSVVPPNTMAPPYPYTTPIWYGKGVVGIGDLLIYVGTVRVEEQGKQGAIRVLRHTFLAGGGIRIIDLNNVRLASEPVNV